MPAAKLKRKSLKKRKRIYLNQRLKRNFFTQPTLMVAKKLLGKYLVRKVNGKILAGKITETEAYIGPADKASHAFGNKITKRNQAEYLIGGHVYIYLVYGMYWQLNISTSKAGRPECVLIRGLEPVYGPGRLCRWLKLNKSFYGEDLTKSKRFWLENRGVKIKTKDIKAGPRIGIDYAGPYWSRKPWRFYIKNRPS